MRRLTVLRSQQCAPGLAARFGAGWCWRRAGLHQLIVMLNVSLLIANHCIDDLPSVVFYGD